MAEAESRSITRRSLVAGSALVPAALAAGLSGVEAAEGPRAATPAADFAAAPSGRRAETADPVYAAIEAHAKAYAACGAYQEAEPGDEVGLEPLLDAEREAAEALAATVPTTLAGTAAALAYVHALNQQDGYPLFDDWHCYVFIGSAATAIRHAGDPRGVM